MAAIPCVTASLASDLVKNCADPVVAGVRMVAKIIDRSKVDIAATKATYITGSANTYASLILNVGGANPYAQTASGIVNYVNTKKDGTYDNQFDKVITGVLLDDGDAASGMINAMSQKDAEFIVVLEHKFVDGSRAIRPGSSAFEIIGLEVGLTTNGQTVSNDKNSADTHGGWAFGLATTESKSRAYWYSTSYAATKALFDHISDIDE